MEKPNIINYDNYRQFLYDMFLFKKKTNPSFSYRVFSRKAGIATSSFLKHVIASQRNLSEQSILKFAKGFDLNRQETEFFERLVRFNQAKNVQERTMYFERMTRSRRYRAAKKVQKDQFEYYSKWYYSAIRELVMFPDFREDPVWISKILHPSIDPKQAENALELLTRLGFLTRDSSGRLTQADSFISTGPEVRTLITDSFHRAMIERSSEAIDSVSHDERDISGITIGLTEKDFPILKKMIVDFRQEVIRLFGGNEKSIDRIYQLNNQLIPLSRSTTKEKGDK